MHLEIKNFKCIDHFQCTFSVGSLNLIKGCSGLGKSTILNAIRYALTGKPNRFKPFSRPKCKTSVILKFEGNVIRREANPNRLTLNTGVAEIDEIEAQSAIDKIFGTYFNDVCTIDQDTGSTFACIGPTAKLAFLEKVSMGEYCQQIKTTTKSKKSKKKY